MREPESWRKKVTKLLNVPFWTVDADVIVPSHLLEKEQYAAFLARRRLEAQLERFLVAPRNLKREFHGKRLRILKRWRRTAT